MKFSASLCLFLGLTGGCSAAPASSRHSNRELSSLDIETSNNGSRYVKIPGQKIITKRFSNDDGLTTVSKLVSSGDDNSGLGSGLVSTPEFELKNQGVFYSVEVGIGSNEDRVTLLLDTGSSDFWVMNSNNSYCSSTTITERDSYIDATSDNGIDCSKYGVFDPSNSKSWSSNGTEFSIAYMDNSSANGTWGQDVVLINGLQIPNLSIAACDSANSPMGVLGIGYQAGEATNVEDNPDRYTYENLPAKMKSSGMINKITYSIGLYDSSTNSANVLFGGIDHGRYSGELALIPVVNTLSSYGYSSPARLEVTLTSVKLGNSEKNYEMLIASGLAPALLDTGTTLSYIPDKILETIAKQLGLEYDFTNRYFTIDCDGGDGYYIALNFQGFEISIPISAFIVNSTGESPPSSSSSSSLKCILGILSSSDESFTLGDNFMSNIYTVVDLEDDVIAMGLATNKDDSNEENIEVITGSIPSATLVPDLSATWGGSDGITCMEVYDEPTTISFTGIKSDVATAKTISNTGGSVIRSDGSSEYGVCNSFLAAVVSFGLLILIIP